NVVKREILKEMERIFSPEFRNRIDETVVFMPLTEEQVRQIAERYIHQIETTLAAANKRMIMTPEVLEKLGLAGYNYAYGARFLKRTIDEKIKIPLTVQWQQGDTFLAEVQEGEIVVHPMIATLT